MTIVQCPRCKCWESDTLPRCKICAMERRSRRHYLKLRAERAAILAGVTLPTRQVRLPPAPSQSVTVEKRCEVCGKACSARARTCGSKCRKALSRRNEEMVSKKPN